jgi:hypothetical protein
VAKRVVSGELAERAAGKAGQGATP